MNEIEVIAAKYAAAAYAKNEKEFLSLYDENVMVFDMWDQWRYSGRDAWAGSVRSWFNSLGSERVGIKFSSILCKLEGDWAMWCAIVRYAGLGPDDVEFRSMENRISWVLTRQNGIWRIVHEHSSSPADFETFKVRLSQEPVSV
ncbi:MAG: nuclear transport factor 2 family protein [Burkholderiaceae bacterium]